MTYQELISKIVQLQEEGLELFNAGKSVLGKNILATHVGSYDGPQVLFQAGIHAREYITSTLLVELARNLHNNNLVEGGGIYFIFLTNPDGAEIVLDGINSVNCNITKQYLTLANGGSEDFSQYKANINLVDLTQTSMQIGEAEAKMCFALIQKILLDFTLTASVKFCRL